MAPRTRLRAVLAPDTTRIDYTYDYGDHWSHELTANDARAGDPATAYPRFIAGECDCPPVDCGGISSFYEMLEARADPSHPRRADISEWLDGDDPELWTSSPSKSLSDVSPFPIEGSADRVALSLFALTCRAGWPQLMS